MKGFDNIVMREEKDIKLKPISPLFQNGEILQYKKPSLISNDTERKLNNINSTEPITYSGNEYITLESADRRHSQNDNMLNKSEHSEITHTDPPSSDRISNTEDNRAYEQHVEDECFGDEKEKKL